MQWGSMAEERAAAMTGDDWIDAGEPARIRMTRAITIDAAPEVVWPWLAQLGRGAGRYSVDRLDNGGKASARHIVSWIPEPRVGDAAALGYLRHLDPGRELAWWTPGVRFLGAYVRAVYLYSLRPEGDGSRLVMRVSATATGAITWILSALLPLIDTIMACRQLKNLKARIERYGDRTEDDAAPETGARDQYQLYHVIYASGEEAGVPGKEDAASVRRAAEEDGVVGG
jgi:hypothetical protein